MCDLTVIFRNRMNKIFCFNTDRERERDVMETTEQIDLWAKQPSLETLIPADTKLHHAPSIIIIFIIVIIIIMYHTRMYDA